MLAKLRRANIARDAVWDPEHKITIAFRGLELGGEVGELQNLLKKVARLEMGLRGSRADMGAIAQELADVIICTDLIAMHLDINLETEVREKFNATSDKYNLEVRL